MRTLDGFAMIAPFNSAAAQAYLAAIVESSNDAIIAKDLNGVVQWCNAATERIFGYSCAELIGQPVRVLIPADRQSEEDSILERMRRGERIEHFETIRVAKDGTLLNISLSVSPVRDSSGDIIGISKVARDITQHRRLEAEAEVRRRVDEQRDRLLESERIARADAERASRAKDEFVAMISHELRTPLNAILGWTQLMISKRNDPTLIDHGLDVVARNTRLQAQLISDLLDISRIVTGKLRLDMRRIRLGAIMTDAIETVQQEADSKGVNIHAELEDVGPAIDGDAARLQQVVWNLLSNAIKFTPAGGRVLVTLRQIDGYVELSVEDTGAGIVAEFLPYVFDQFQQADGSITRQFGGLGLGLAIVKHLVQLHGGAIHAASGGQAKGAKFTLVLPTTSNERVLTPLADDDSTRATAVGNVSLAGVRILVVEDELDAREFLTRLLEHSGAMVFTAGSVREALGLFPIVKPDVLVSDIGLPDVDGYELLHQIRAKWVGDGGSVPAVALTAYARAEDEARATRAGYQAHIAKPVESNELVATIARLTAGALGAFPPSDK